MRKLLALILLLALTAGCIQQTGRMAEQFTVTVMVNGEVVDTLIVARGTTALEAFDQVLTLSKQTHPEFGTYITGVNGVEQDFDTIMFNAMLPVLTVFAIMERFVKKVGRFSVTKAGFIWSILMIIVPLLIIGILG